MAFFHDLFNIDDSKRAHEDIYGPEPSHHSTWIHELIAGAAGFAGKIHIFFILSENY
jgi:hypothetical protein